MAVTDYDPESRAHCAACGTGLGYVSDRLQGCPWEGCPDYGVVPDDDAADPGPLRSVPITRREAIHRVGLVALHGATGDEIARFERELAGAGTRTLDGEAALVVLERKAWLDLMEIAGQLVEIEHRAR